MKLIILDRDGIINRDSDEFVKSPEEWEPMAADRYGVKSIPTTCREKGTKNQCCIKENCRA